MATKLTKSFIESIPLATSGQVFYRDSELKGFALRVGTTGKVYIAESKVNRKVIRVTIGKHGVYTAEQARLQAREILLTMTKGINPNDVEKEERARGVTLDQALEDFFIARKSLKPATVYDYRRCLNCYLPDWKKRPLLEITKDMVAKRHTLIGQRSKAQANLAMRYLRPVQFCCGSVRKPQRRTHHSGQSSHTSFTNARLVSDRTPPNRYQGARPRLLARRCNEYQK